MPTADDEFKLERERFAADREYTSATLSRITLDMLVMVPSSVFALKIIAELIPLAKKTDENSIVTSFLLSDYATESSEARQTTKRCEIETNNVLMRFLLISCQRKACAKSNSADDIERSSIVCKISKFGV